MACGVLLRWDCGSVAKRMTRQCAASCCFQDGCAGGIHHCIVEKRHHGQDGGHRRCQSGKNLRFRIIGTRAWAEGYLALTRKRGGM